MQENPSTTRPSCSVGTMLQTKTNIHTHLRIIGFNKHVKLLIRMVKTHILLSLLISIHIYINNNIAEQSRIMARLNQAVEERNRPKLQKCLTRAKELNPKNSHVDIMRAETLLKELLDGEGNLILIDNNHRHINPLLTLHEPMK